MVVVVKGVVVVIEVVVVIGVVIDVTDLDTGAE